MLRKPHLRGLRAALPSAFAAFELSGATLLMLAANNKIQPRPKVTPPHTGTKMRCVTVSRCGLNLLWFRKHRPDLRIISVFRHLKTTEGFRPQTTAKTTEGGQQSTFINLIMLTYSKTEPV